MGRQLALALVREGHQVRVLCRNTARARHLLPLGLDYVEWKGAAEGAPPPARAYDGIDGVINLMGEPIFKGPWSRSKMAKVENSRVLGSKFLIEGLGQRPLKFFLQASASGIYPFSPDPQSEGSALGEHYLAQLCQKWEATTSGLKQVTPTLLRLGVVLHQDAQIIEQTKLATHFRLSPLINSGEQSFSWIHCEDAVAAILHCIRHLVTGAVNLASPDPCSMKSFNSEIAKAMGLKALRIPMPAGILRQIMGPPTDVISHNQVMAPRVLHETGFSFKFPGLVEALRDCLGIFKDPVSGKEQCCFILERFQKVTAPIDKVWPFFANPANLEAITPSSLKFKILTPETDTHLGQIIEYRLRLNGFPMGWRSKILELVEGKYFVDYQLKGPYEVWHHLHTFEPMKDGTLLTDKVYYKLPFGALGLVALPFVRRDLNKIFGHRVKMIDREFT